MSGTRKRDPEETRRRIVEATVELHRELGPSNTTITAIAERAGVQRLTVYRHFPDEAAVLQACSSHWSEDHPLPDSSQWAGERDPSIRLKEALDAIFQYYRGGHAMLEMILRDEGEVQALADLMQPYHAWFREAAAQLSTGWGTEGALQSRLRAFIGHSLQFDTWKSLTDQGLSDSEASSLLNHLAVCLAHGSPSIASSHPPESSKEP